MHIVLPRQGRKRPRVTIVHDYLSQRGGAERVVLALMRAFPSAVLMTSVYEPAATYPDFKEFDIRTMWLNRVGVFRKDPRLALPFLAAAFSAYDLPPSDVVLCSSSGWAHGIRTTAPKIVYCHNPPRWIHQTSDYATQQALPSRLVLETLRNRLTKWDRSSALSASVYLANSSTVQQRIMKAYGLQASILPPPVSLNCHGPQDPIPGTQPGFLLVVSRPRGYKNGRILLEAMRNLPNDRLLVVGGLPPGVADVQSEDRVQSVRNLTDAQLRWAYANCKALVAVSHEDFGLTPLEANAFGKPAACLRAGGYLDTLKPGLNGFFIEAPSAQAVVACIQRLAGHTFDEQAIRLHADQYSEQRFGDTLRAIAAHLIDGEFSTPGSAIDLRNLEEMQGIPRVAMTTQIEP